MLPDGLPSARLHPSVQPDAWRQALLLVEAFIAAMNGDNRFSEDWEPCREALVAHLEDARMKIGRLG